MLGDDQIAPASFRPLQRCARGTAGPRVSIVGYTTMQRKGDPGKVAIGDRLRLETTMTPAWDSHRVKVSAILLTDPNSFA
jgi:hypothetical protein